MILEDIAVEESVTTVNNIVASIDLLFGWQRTLAEDVLFFSLNSCNHRTLSKFPAPKKHE